MIATTEIRQRVFCAETTKILGKADSDIVPDRNLGSHALGATAAAFESAGICNITSTTNWVSSPPTTGIQCTNFTVAPAVTLTVPSGTMIHATGTVTISGTLTVQAGGAQGLYLAQPVVATETGGVALSASALRKLLHPGVFGGGNGGWAQPNGLSGLGGGSIVILASGAISVTGSITANGHAGLVDGATATAAGGGAGGIIILASKTSISNSGNLSANGGVGANRSNGNSDASAGGRGRTCPSPRTYRPNYRRHGERGWRPRRYG